MPISTHNIPEFWGQNFYRHSANLILLWLFTFKKNVKSHVFLNLKKTYQKLSKQLIGHLMGHLLGKGELARPRRSRGIVTCPTRDLSSCISVVWPEYSWWNCLWRRYNSLFIQTVPQFLIRLEKKCWQWHGSVRKLFFFKFSEWHLVWVLVSSSKESTCQLSLLPLRNGKSH